MSRRSSRRPPKKDACLPAGVKLGLASLVEGNESTVSSMLSVHPPDGASPDATSKTLVAALADCMAVNNLSAEALLARFFDVSLLSAYCEDRLGASGKGNEATLAARIARAWSKPGFEPLLLEKGVAKPAKKSGTKEGGSAKKGGKTKKEQKKRAAEKTDSIADGIGNKEATKKRRVWCAAIEKPNFTVTAPPGPLGLTIRQYADEFIVSGVSPTCAIPETQGDFPRVTEGAIIATIDGQKIQSESDDNLKVCDWERRIEIQGKIISMNAADQPKGRLLWMKEAGVVMFRTLDYSDVAEKYGEEFLDELNPPNKGKSGRQILAGALTSLCRK